MKNVNGKIVFDNEDLRRWTPEEIKSFLEFYKNNSIMKTWSGEMQEKSSLFHIYAKIAFEGFSRPDKCKEYVVDGDVFINLIQRYRTLTEKVIANLITNYLVEDKIFENEFTDNIIDYPESFGNHIINMLEGEEELVELVKALATSWSAGKEYGDVLEKITGVKNIYNHISHKKLSIKYNFAFSNGNQYSIDDFFTIRDFLISIRTVLILLTSALKCVNNMPDFIDLISIPTEKSDIYTLSRASLSLIPKESRNFALESFMRTSIELSYSANLVLNIFWNIYGMDEIIFFYPEDIEKEIIKVNAKGFNFYMKPKE